MLPHGMGVFGIYRERLVAGLAAGQTLDELDTELLAPRRWTTIRKRLSGWSASR